MSGTAADEFWGAVPIRAAADPRLSAAHYKLLIVVARFAGFEKNGSGCYATQATMAKLTGMHVTTVSRKLGELRQLGYLKAKRQQNRRRLQYSVAYSDAADCWPDEQVSSGDSCSAEQVTEDDTCSTGPYKEIPLRGFKDIPQRSVEIYPPKVRRFAPLRFDDGSENVMGTLCRMRRDVVSRPLSVAELEWLEEETLDSGDLAVDRITEEVLSEHEWRWQPDDSGHAA